MNQKENVQMQKKRKDEKDNKGGENIGSILQTRISDMKGEQIYDKVLSELNEYSYPNIISCRDREKQEIYNYLKEGINNKG